MGRGVPAVRGTGSWAMSGPLSTEARTLPERFACARASSATPRFVRDAKQEWSYAEFAHRASQMAAGLREPGVGRGDVVGVSPEQPALPRGVVGDHLLGATFNPVNPALTSREAAGILADSGAVCVVCTPEAAAASRSCATSCRRSARSWSPRVRTRRGAARSRDGRRSRAVRRQPARGARLHVRYDRAAEGRDAVARQPPGERMAAGRAAPRWGAATRWGWCCPSSTSTRRWSRR